MDALKSDMNHLLVGKYSGNRIWGFQILANGLLANQLIDKNYFYFTLLPNSKIRYTITIDEQGTTYIPWPS